MNILTIAYFVVGTAMQISFMAMFFLAYLSPQKTVRVWINRFGEADLELLILFFFLFLMLRAWFIFLQKLYKKFYKEVWF